MIGYEPATRRRTRMSGVRRTTLVDNAHVVHTQRRVLAGALQEARQRVLIARRP
jgi:hypothetical protein